MLGTSRAQTRGRQEAAHHQAAWISARSRTISNENFCGRDNFRKFRSEIRSKSHAPQHADARNRCWGPQRVVRKLRTTRRHAFLRDPARFRTKNVAAATIFENFGPKSAPNRTKSYALQHADPRNRCWGPLGVVRKLCTTRRHGSLRDLARFRTQNFAAAKIFENFGPKSALNRTRHSILTLATDVGDL